MSNLPFSVRARGDGSWFGPICLEVADFGAVFFDGSFIRLVLTGGGVVAGARVEQAKEADGIYRAEVIGQDGDSTAVEFDGTGVNLVVLMGCRVVENWMGLIVV